MINAFIGKIQKDNSIAYIYCHNKADMSVLGKILIQQYNSEQAVEGLLKAGHCYFPNSTNNGNWKLANKENFEAGGKCHYCNNKEDFLDKAIEDVQIAYLFEKGKWRYLNALSVTPTFIAARLSPGRKVTNKSDRNFQSHIVAKF